MSAHTLNIALAQLNPVMGDITGNVDKVRRAVAVAFDADIVLTSELVTCGYPPEDLVQRPSFLDKIREEVEAYAAELTADDPAVLLGTPWMEDGELFNAVLVLEAGKITAVRKKVHLPNYGVFDEKRLFASGPLPAPVMVRGVPLGLPICEDIWETDVVAHLKAQGAEILLVTNGSPYNDGKHEERQDIARARCAEVGLPLVYVNQVGGQDEVVFDGASFVMNAAGEVVAGLPDWQEHVETIAFTKSEGGDWSASGMLMPWTEDLEATYMAMVVGLRDYVNKNGFPGVVLGLSGGIDSGLSLVVAVDALGKDRVRAVMMPSQYTSEDSLEDARLGAEYVDIQLDTISIVPGVSAFDDMLSGVFAGTTADTTEENIQARLRGLILMSISNKFGHMVLTTGNKSEMSVGYATLYGDMCGGYSVLKDVYKTRVFDLAWWRNAHKPKHVLGPKGKVVPERVITKPPTAELRPDQKDEDSLPPYDVLDGILMGLVEREVPLETLVSEGYDRATVHRIEHLLYIAEYKRRQAPPGVKTTPRNYGRDRRYPITNRFRDPKE